MLIIFIFIIFVLGWWIGGRFEENRWIRSSDPSEYACVYAQGKFYKVTFHPYNPSPPPDLNNDQ